MSSSNKIPRIVLTMGEPAGIGPELLVKIAQFQFVAEIVVLANLNLLQKIARQLDLPLVLELIDWGQSPKIHQISTLKIENVDLNEPAIAGELNSSNSSSVLCMLSRAGQLALEQRVDAVVTAPVHKSVLNKIDAKFMGHTEFFALQAQVKKVVMMLATNQLRIALATIHIPLAEVSETISQDLIEQIVKIIDKAFTQFNLSRPKIAVCGLNPHAGEDGLLGNQDQEKVAPAIKLLKESGVNVEGPFPADSLFTPNKRKTYDVFLAMYHDQGLPVVKAIGFGQCANITLGLPYIRTSVDHGTALDIAPLRVAVPDSLEYAINYAIQLVNGQLPK